MAQKSADKILDDLQEKVVVTAEEMVARGEVPTPAELKILKQQQAEELEEAGHKFMESCPLKVFQDRTGLNSKSINSLADVHGVPVRGRPSISGTSSTGSYGCPETIVLVGSTAAPRVRMMPTNF